METNIHNLLKAQLVLQQILTIPVNPDNYLIAIPSYMTNLTFNIVSDPNTNKILSYSVFDRDALVLHADYSYDDNGELVKISFTGLVEGYIEFSEIVDAKRHFRKKEVKVNILKVK